MLCSPDLSPCAASPSPLLCGDRCNAPPFRSGKCFAFELDPKESPDDPEPTEVPVRVLLSVAHDGEYPETAPPLKLRAIRGANAADMVALEARLAQEVEDNLGASFAIHGPSRLVSWS